MAASASACRWSRGWWSCTAAASRLVATASARGSEIHGPPAPPRGRRFGRSYGPPRPGPAPAGPVQRRILAGHDLEDSASTLGMILLLTGHETRTAHDGLEAVEAAAASGPT